MTGPVAWIRFCGDGCVEGPILDSVIEEVQRKSGAWTPLYAAPQPAPAIDLEQFRLHLKRSILLVKHHTKATDQEIREEVAEAGRLLALIDGQAGVTRSREAGAAYDIINEFLQCAEVGRPHGNLLAQARDYLAANSPTKGEGVAGRACPRAEHCQNGRADICLASQRDGVVCPDDECDIDTGQRFNHTKPWPTKGEGVGGGR